MTAFADEVMKLIPNAALGVPRHSAEAVGTMQDGEVIAVYFLRCFGPDGKPLNPHPELSDMDAGKWEQVAIHVTASGKEIIMWADDIPGLARRRVQEAFDEEKIRRAVGDFFVAAA